MTVFRFVTISLAAALCLVGGERAEAGQRRGPAIVGRAAPRSAIGPRRVIVAPRVVGIAPFRSYYYRPGFALGIYGGYPFGYGYYGYGYPYYYRPYGYSGYPYPAGGYAAYGGVRIEGAPRDAQVFADGYYVGVVDNFDGVFQHVTLTPGAHRIEIRSAGLPPIAFDVRIEPGQTITYRADVPPVR